MAVRPGALPALATCLLAFVLAGCGDGGSSAARPTKTLSAPTKPMKGCLAIDYRKGLANNPPDIGVPFVSTDLDNFTGATPAECNRRALVYWGPDTVLTNSDRPVVILTLTFVADVAGARRLAESAAPSEVVRVGKARVQIFQRDGQAGGRYPSGPALVDVLVACLRPSDLQSPVACQRPPQSAQFLRARLRGVLGRLLPQLKASS